MHRALLVFILLLGGLFAAIRPRPGADPVPPAEYVRAPSVRLAVLVVFDQLRGDYIVKWREHFPPGGFRRMQDRGAWFADCHYPYAATVTGAGHASLLSGATPSVHGIIGNDWYDRKAAGNIYCAATDRYENVPYTRPDDSKKKAPGGSPLLLKADTIADELKRATAGQSKVFGLSLKDRSALLPVGQKPDGAYWFSAGQFITSTYYRDAPHAWVRAFNRARLADRFFGRKWDRSRPDLNYDAIVGPDKFKGEGGGAAQWGEFPHPTDGGKKSVGKDYYTAMANSPFGNELLLAFAERCIVAEGLGKGDVPDLLNLSFSSNDLVGHAWGPDSQEVFDMTLRSDRILAQLFEFLDRTVGPNEYIVVLSADHGVCPMPEVSTAKGLEAKRVQLGPIQDALEKGLSAAIGPPPAPGKENKPGKWIEAINGPWVYLNDRQLVAAHRERADVANILAKLATSAPHIQSAYSYTELTPPAKPKDATHARVKAGYYPGRSGDVGLVLKPYYLISDPVKGSGSSHGSPHAYDTHVPLLAYGPGLLPGLRSEPSVPQLAAPILSYALGIAPPKQCEYPLPSGLFAEP
jgi:hypothetical protein